MSYTPLAPLAAGTAFIYLDVFDRAVDICRQRGCANCCSIPALAELDTALLRCSLSSTLLASAARKCSTYMAVRTRSGRRSGATPLNGSAAAPYEWKLDALLTVVYLAVLYYWR